MAVDANVLILERIREELRAGKTARAAIDAGYERAWPPILDSNVTTFLSGLILFQFGSGPIRGFAVTLCIGSSSTSSPRSSARECGMTTACRCDKNRTVSI